MVRVSYYRFIDALQQPAALMQSNQYVLLDKHRVMGQHLSARANGGAGDNMYLRKGDTFILSLLLVCVLSRMVVVLISFGSSVSASSVPNDCRVCAVLFTISANPSMAWSKKSGFSAKILIVFFYDFTEDNLFICFSLWVNQLWSMSSPCKKPPCVYTFSYAAHYSFVCYGYWER